MRNLHPVVKLLMTTRGLRSLGQGIMVVDLALYLKALHWSGASIGMVLTVGSLFSSILILFVGILSDRIGRKPFLIIAEGLSIISSLGACLTSNAIFLSLAIILAGFGRGQTGAAGPFAPAEQAWLARLVRKEHRGEVYSINTAIGFFGMGIGALLGGLPTLFHHVWSGAFAFRPIFAIIALFSVICLIIILKMPEDKISTLESNEEAKQAEPSQEERNKAITREENKWMAKLAFVNVLNGLAIGLTGPLMSYWFSIKFGVGSVLIGTTLGLSFIGTGLASIINGKLSSRFGLVSSVVWLRLCGVVLLVLLPFAPVFWIAAIIYIVRNALSRGTQGARAALSASITRDKRRGLSSSLSAISMRLPSSIGPTISGFLLDAGLVIEPFLISAGLQFAYALFFQYIFRRFNYKKEQP